MKRNITYPTGYNIYIGIDTGTKTGVAIYNKNNKSLELYTMAIYDAITKVIELSKLHNIYVVVEDARQRKYYGDNAGIQALQGVGSIKRDCTIWEETMMSKGIDFIMVHPIKGGTKLDANLFKNITGYSNRCSSHARDAAMLVYGI
jgi:hypothetical protein